jgi:hypothetical protein
VNFRDQLIAASLKRIEDADSWEVFGISAIS